MKSTTGFDQKSEIMIPFFALPSVKNGKIGPKNYYMKNNLVVVFFHPDCSFCHQKLADLNDDYTRYRSNNAEIMAVASSPITKLRDLVDELGLNFTVLADEDGEVITKIMNLVEPQEGLPAVFVFDRFGALQGWQTSSDREVFPDQDEILDKLFYIETQCPECGIYP